MEWFHGLDGNPSIQAILESPNNRSWAVDNRTKLTRRKQILREVQKRAKELGVDGAIAELESARNGNSLSWLVEQIRAKRR
jgi:hypothetical protein